MQGMAEYEDNHFDLIITSPPYNKGSAKRKPHKTDTWSGGNAAIKYGDYEDNMPEADYQQWQIEFINQCLRILKPSGSFFYNHKNRTKDRAIISPLEWILKSNALVKQEIIWDRRMIVEVDKVRFYPKTERFYWLIKERTQPDFNGEYAQKTDIWEVLPTQGDNRHNHSAPFPLKLAEMVVLSCSQEGDTVLDPFMGSGTTAVACEKHNRYYVGFEIDKDYYDSAQKRLKQFRKQLKLAL